MADNILKQLYKNTESVSKDIKSMDTTLSKLLKLEQKQEKFDQKKHKEETAAKKKEARNEKRKTADFQGFKGIVKMKKSEKGKEKNSLMDLLMGGLGQVVSGITNTIQGLVSDVTSAIGGIGTAIIGAIGGLGLGSMLTGALGVVAPVLLAAVAAAGAAALMNPDVQKFIDKHIGDKMSQMGLGNWFRNQRESDQGYSYEDAKSISDGTIRRRGESSHATQADKDRLATVNSITTLRGKMAQLEDHNTRYRQMIVNHTEQIARAEAKNDTTGADHQRSEIEKYKTLLNDNTAEYNSHEAKIQDLILTAGLESTYNEIGWTKRQTGGHINVPGSGEGDKVPMLLPQGSFVLNKMASMHFQTGGMVPTLLEPGEKVFMPGDWDSAIEQLNGVIPRFQTGGYVGAPRSSMTDTGETDYKGRKVLLSPKAAAGWEAMMAAGMPYNPQDITNVYRDAAEYQRLIKKGYGAASNSAHNFGEAADIHGAMNTWIRQNGMKYGWAANDYTGTHGGHFEYVGAGAGSNRADGKEEAAAESLTQAALEGGNGLMDMAGGLMSGMGDALKGAFEGLSAFGEGFSEGFGNTVDKSNPIVGMISNALGGVSSAVSSIGNMFGGGGDNLFSNLFGGGNNASSPNGTGPIDMGADTNAKLKKMAGYAMQAGFTKEQAKVMAAIAAGESTFNNRAHNTKGEDNSYGLWQINMLDRPGYMLGAERRKKFGLSSNDQLFDPLTNAKAAKAIFDSGQGFNAWGAYTDGNAGKYMNAAKALKLQNGGIVPTPSRGVVTRKSSDLMSRMSQAQSKFSQGISLSVKPIIVYEDEKPVTVSTQADVSMLPPDLPDGPGTAMAADYFYQLSLGNQ